MTRRRNSLIGFAVYHPFRPNGPSWKDVLNIEFTLKGPLPGLYVLLFGFGFDIWVRVR